MDAATRLPSRRRRLVFVCLAAALLHQAQALRWRESNGQEGHTQRLRSRQSLPCSAGEVVPEHRYFYQGGATPHTRVSAQFSADPNCSKENGDEDHFHTPSRNSFSTTRMKKTRSIFFKNQNTSKSSTRTSSSQNKGQEVVHQLEHDIHSSTSSSTRRGCPQARPCNCSCVCPETVFVPPVAPALLQAPPTCSGPACGPQGCPPVAPCNCFCACRPPVPQQ
ncbi:unnamed protein product [Amoebophrya sp. A25]|nr:unnamed protein product [Amoebophrya sp. A25]|eukprot:GSA25T00000711001.1